MTVQWSVVKRSLNRWIAGVGDTVDDTVNGKRTRFSITSLSWPDKTVFLHSMIQNLLALGAGRNTLPRPTVRMAGNAGTRLVGVYLLPAEAPVVLFLDQSARLAGVADEHLAWSLRTDDIALRRIGRPRAENDHFPSRQSSAARRQRQWHRADQHRDAGIVLGKGNDDRPIIIAKISH